MNWTEPSIEKGVERPLPSRYQRNAKYGTLPKRVSPWIAFLGKLEPGDSFVIDTRYKGLSIEVVKRNAKKVGIKIEWRWVPRLMPNGYLMKAEARFWRVE